VEATARLDSCPTCSTLLPPDARFCPGCGRRTDLAADEAAPADLPVEEPGEVPVTVREVEPQYFGLGAPALVFGVAVVLLVLAVLLLALGNWVAGLLLLAAAFLLLPAFLAGVRRWPDSAIAQLSLRTADRARDEASVAAETISTWSRAGREVVRRRREQFQLRRELDDKLRQLGRSVLDADRNTPTLTAEARELDERLRASEQELAETLETARRRVRSERAAIASTEVLRADDETSRTLAGERPEDEGEPVDADDVGLDAEDEDGGEGGAEPGRGAKQ
jgi:hypothetical protein